MPNPEKVSTNFKLTKTVKSMLEQLADNGGVSRTAIIELLIREKAESKGIKAEHTRREAQGARDDLPTN